MRLLLVMAAALPVACSFSPADDGFRYRCDVTADCPTGTSCRPDGYCGAPDDGGPLDAGPAEACGTTDALRDDFASPAATAARWDCNQEIEVRDGRLVISAPAMTDLFGSCRARRFYLFDGSGVSVRVTGPGAAGTWLEANLLVEYPDGSGHRIQALNGGLVFHHLVGQDSTEVFRADYDPAEHAWWRLAERGGAVVFATSRDGTAWEERASDRTLPAAPVYARPSLQGWASEARTEPGEITLDDVNPGALGSRCAIGSLVDGFEAELIAHWWQPVGGDTCVVELRDGAMAMSSMGTYIDCGVESRLGYVLGEDTPAVEVALPGDGGPSLNFELADPLGNAYRFHLHESRNLAVQIEQPGGDYDETVDTVYDPGRHRRWRFRQQAGVLHLEAAGADGVWIELHQLAPAGPLDDLVVRLFSLTEGQDADLSPVAVDHLNE